MSILDDYATSTAGGMASALAAGEVSAVELCEAAISRIEALDGPINAVVVRDFDRAMDAARAADAALARGERRPLLGVPMTVKEAFNVAWQKILYAKGWIAPRDATGVERLKAAGAVILGKTNVPPMLADWQTDNPIYGRTNNPLDLTRTPGGSSGGGAAALAAGMVPLEFGSDIGGSIRVPSAFCGVYGHKPSHDLAPQRGHTPPPFDGAGPPLNVVGPLARCVSDLSLALDILAGPDELAGVGYRLDLPRARHADIREFRVLIVDSHPLATVDSEIRQALHDLAARLTTAGAKVTYESDLLPDLTVAQSAYWTLLTTIMSRGGPPQPALGPGSISAHDWMNALDAQLACRRQWGRLFETFDIVLAPVMGVVAFPHDASPFNDRIHVINGLQTPYAAQIAWPAMATLANLPATAFPAGTTRGGLPIGLQAIGPYLEDRTTLAFVRLMEEL